MIFGYVLVILLPLLVLSEPDLCGNPKIDSITYVSGKSMWFFTSGGFYWYIKEKDFPPGSPTGKLPDGFTRGDAAFYSDWIKICVNSRLSRQTNQRVKTDDQLVILVEKADKGNQIIQFDTRLSSWSNNHTLEDNHMIGRTHIEDPKAEIDAIFTIRDSDVYVVQKQRYAAVDLKPLCKDPKGWSNQFPSQSVDALGNSNDVPFDAIAIKDNFMYYFIGSKFWMSRVDIFKSKDGKIVISKGSQQNVSSNFFKFKECPKIDTTPQESTQTGKTSNTPENSKTSDQIPMNKTEGTVPDEEQSNSDSSSVGLFFLIVIIVAVLVVVVLVIAIIFAMRGKSKPDQEAKKPAAQSSKYATKPNNSMTSKTSKK